MGLSRTWMVRGAGGVVLAVVSGAWALGIAATGGTSAHDSAAPADPETTSVSVPEEAPEGEVAGIVEDADPSTPASADPSAVVPVVETSDAASETPEADEPGTPAPTRAAPTRNPAPSTPSGKPTKTPTPSKTPTPTPSPTQPGSRCTDLISGLNCVLAPITSRP